MKRAFFLLVVLCLAVIAPLVRAQQAEQTEREAMYYRYMEFASLVKGGSIQPHWMADGSSFWYTEGGPANTVIWKVDPKEDTKNPLFDTARLRQVLTDALGHEPPYQGLPFDKFTFVEEGEKAVKFTVEGKEFILQLDTYTIARAPVLSEEEKNRLVPRVGQKGLSGWPEAREVLSPDRRWFASLKEHNLWLRSTYDGRSVQITTDGVKDYQWAAATHWQVGPWAVWSPDSFKLAVKKEDSRAVESVLVAHWLKPSAEVEWFHKPRTGGPLPQTELFVVDILSKRQVRLDTGEEPDHYFYILGWRPDGSELLFLRTDREHKKLDLMAANPNTGATRVV
ncbi:MAG: DPP IV N-terminal domain-containing protein, partial [Planctomycetota bacterium]